VQASPHFPLTVDDAATDRVLYMHLSRHGQGKQTIVWLT
jgi:hypothetical protein